MNTIKIYLAESGRIADLHKDIPLYQGQFNDKLLNVYVPTSILAPHFDIQHYIGQISGVNAPTDLELNAFVEANTYPSREQEQGDIVEFYDSDDQKFYIYQYNNNSWVSTEVESFGTLNNIAGTSVKIGLIATQRNGAIYKSKSYFMRYLKTLTYQGVEYALYERKLPKEFTSLAGQGQNAPTIIANVVNVDTTNSSITSIITSQTCHMDVMPSTMLDQDETIEATDFENLEAQVNTNAANIALKQDKYDNELTTNEKRVVAAINELNGKVLTNESNIETNTGDIADIKTEQETQNANIETNTDNIETNTGNITDLQSRVSTLENTVVTGETYIGTLSGASLPTTNALDSFVLEVAERQPVGGDYLYFILEIEGETDKNYKYTYSNVSGWSYAEIPTSEPADNSTLGIVKGNYDGETSKNFQVNIIGGDFKGIYVVDRNATLRELREYLNTNDNRLSQNIAKTNANEGDIATNSNNISTLQSQMTGVLNGSTAVGKATLAEKDENGRNIVNTYLTQNAGVTKTQMYNYALPRTFNDVSFLGEDNEYVDQIPSGLGAIYTLTTSAVGEFTLCYADKTISERTFQLASKNSYTDAIFVTANVNCTVTFKVTTQIYKNNEWVTLNTEMTDQVNMVANEIKKVSFGSPLNSLDSVITVESGDIIRQIFDVVTETSTSITFNLYSNAIYPSVFYINTTAQAIVVSQGMLGEIPVYEITGEIVDDELVFDIPQAKVLNNQTMGLFLLSYANTIPSNTVVKLTQGGQDIRIVTLYNIDGITQSTIEELSQAYVEGVGIIFNGVISVNNGDISVIALIDNLSDITTAIGGLDTRVGTLETDIDNKVDFSKAQTLTDAQKAQARANIGAGSAVATEVRVNNVYVSQLDFDSDPQTQLDNKQATIDASHKIDADYVDDTNSTNKFVTTSEKSTWNGKQNALSQAQLDAVNSGIDSTKVTQIQTNTNDIDTIEGKIPSAASSSNQLADKEFVNSSVQTATANFRGNWGTWALVPTSVNDYPEDYAESKTPTVNDYLVVQDASGYTGQTLTGTWRFKYSGTWATNGKNGWLPEYQVNETPLTAAQLAALNSGANSTNIGQIAQNTSDINANAQAISNLNTGKVDKVSTANKVYGTDGSGNQVEYTVGLAAQNIALRDGNGCLVSPTPSGNTEVANKKYVDDADALKQDLLTFDTTPTENSNNPVTSGGVYSALAHGKVRLFQGVSDASSSKSVTIDASINPTMVMFEGVANSVNELFITTIPYEVLKGWNYQLAIFYNRETYLVTSNSNITESVSGNSKTITFKWTKKTAGNLKSNSFGAWLVW